MDIRDSGAGENPKGFLTRHPFGAFLVLVGTFSVGFSQVTGLTLRDLKALWTQPATLTDEQRSALRGRLRTLAVDGALSVDESHALRAYAASLGLEAQPAEQYLAEIQPRMLKAARELQEGAELAGQARLPEARARFREAIRQDDESATAWANFGGTALESGDLAEAEAALRKALALEPENIGAHYNFGACLAAQNRGAAALDHLERSLTLLLRSEAPPVFERQALLDDLETSAHFSTLRGSPRFTALIRRIHDDFR